jgi:hypothetical protein
MSCSRGHQLGESKPAGVPPEDGFTKTDCYVYAQRREGVVFSGTPPPPPRLAGTGGARLEMRRTTSASSAP